MMNACVFEIYQIRIFYFFGDSEDDIHLEEHETEVSDLEQAKKILKAMDIDEVLTLQKVRNTFIYKNIFEIALDSVTDLGYFIEIEVKDNNLSVVDANLKLKNLVQELGLSMDKCNLDGYANMLYRKLYEKN